jgi:hypothetical protein
MMELRDVGREEVSTSELDRSEDGGSKDLWNVGKLLPRSYNPEDSHLRTHRSENLKSYLIMLGSNGGLLQWR